MSNPYYVAISGIMGSGKTTLAEGLSKNFGWELAQPNKYSNNYLTDLFKDMSRWAFEAQISFLTNKAFEIIHLIEQNKNFVLDRSLYEDSSIFVNYFHSKKKIDNRGYLTYNNLFEHFNLSIKSPDLIIYCECDIKTIKNRIEIRKREIQKLYPENHLNDIYDLYLKWVNDFKICPFYKINTAEHDLRDKKIMQSVAEEVALLLKSRFQSQFNLFDSAHTKLDPKYLKSIIPNHSFENLGNSYPINIKINKYSSPPFPFAYIAAPFTSKAIDIKNNESDIYLLHSDPLHGSISVKNEFRQMLIGIEKKLKSIKINSLLPHRDVSKWGISFVSSNEVFESCTNHVTNCSLFIGIVGESNGSHFELGLAYALKKSIILIRCTEIPNSYISNGITEDIKTIKIFNCTKIKDIPNLISSNECLEFLLKQNLLKS